MKKVAVVTGSYRNIGFGIVRGLCKSFDGDVILTARNKEAGLGAVETLQKEGFSPKFHLLDVCDDTSINTLRDYVKDTYGGVDVFVNNACQGHMDDSIPVPEQVERMLKTNFFSTIATWEAFKPLLRKGARVVHVGSLSGLQGFMEATPELQAKLKEVTTIEEVVQIVEEFQSAAKKEKEKDIGWLASNPSYKVYSTYCVSKWGMMGAAAVQQQLMDAERPSDDILVNCCCPGYVDTILNNNTGYLTIDQGAENPLYLALLPKGSSVRGDFISDFKVFKWKSEDIKDQFKKRWDEMMQAAKEHGESKAKAAGRNI